MAMAVDRAGQHEMARRVDLARPGGEAAPQRGDDAVRDGDIALRRVGGGRHRAVADDEIVIGHRCSLRRIAENMPSACGPANHCVARRTMTV